MPLINISLLEGKPETYLQALRAFYMRLPELLQERIGLRPEDVFINVVMTDKENWSLGKGKMQLVDELK